MTFLRYGIFAVGLFVQLSSGQCLENFERIREMVDMTSFRCNGLEVAADGPFVVIGNMCGEAGLDFYGYATVYRWNEARGRWDYEQRIEPSNGGTSGPESNFAWSLAIDGNNIIAGAHQGLTTNYEGITYFYERDVMTGMWSEIGLTKSSAPAEDDLFGWGVALDGDQALITAPGEDNGGTDRGTIYFYTKAGSAWTRSQRIPSPFLDDQLFGWSADMDGDLAVVGSPKQAGNKAVVYRRENGSWVQEQVLTGDDTDIGDEFGNAVAISGNTIAVGAHFHDGAGGSNAGAVYMFERDPDAMSWSQTQRIEWGIGGGRLTETFAPSRGLALDGDQMFAVARFSELVQRYRRQGDQWVSTSVIDASSSVSAGGGTIIAGDGSEADGYADVIRCADMDTDGDGLLDKWETEGEGYDANLDGIVDINLYDRGARFDRKDLFYELDRMVGVPYDEEAVVDVIEAFANAPVSNPDGSTGITLHIDLNGIDDIPFDSEWDDFGTEFEVAKDLYWGTPAERVDPNADGLLEAKRDVYRYGVIIKDFIDGALGLAETPGNDLIVAYGSMMGDRHAQASTLMHEIGHNLNLSHGGVVQDDGGGGPNRGSDDLPVPDNTNYKPNHVSVMNYAFDRLTDAFGNKLPVDFSRDKMDSLEESSLNENTGLVSSVYDTVWVLHGYRPVPGEQPRVRRVQIGTTALDWNGDGMIDSSVAVDLNWLGPGYPGGGLATFGERLDGCNDWDFVVLPFSDALAYERSQHIVPTDFEELTVDGLQFLRDNVPPPPGLCPADLNDDGALDFFDVSAFLTAYNAMDAVADFNDDGMFNFFDVSAFLTAFNAGCP